MLFVLIALVTPRAFSSHLVSTLVLFFLMSLSNGEELSPRELFRRCARVPPDESAWRELFRRYRAPIFTGIAKVLGSSGEQHHRLFEEARQEFYVRLLANDCRALLAFRGDTEGEASYYLHRIAVNVALNVVKKNPKNKVDNIDDPDVRAPLVPGPGGSVLTRIDLEACLQQEMHGRNKARNILIFKLFALEGLKPSEIAEIASFHMSGHAVEIQISRTRKKLRECFGDK